MLKEGKWVQKDGGGEFSESFDWEKWEGRGVDSGGRGKRRMERISWSIVEWRSRKISERGSQGGGSK